MNLLPIVERELRVASRQSRTYWSRLTAGLMAVAFSGIAIFTGGTFISTPQLGRKAFCTLSVVALLGVLATASRMTTDALSKEIREGTLGLLFLSKLKVYDIVLGKLAATMLGSFYQFLAAVPALALPILVGGVTVLDVGRGVIGLLNVMLLTAATGLLASSLTVRQGRASGVATLILAALLVAMPIAGIVLAERNGPSALADGLVKNSPGYAWVQSVVPGFFAVGSFWRCIAVTQAVSWGFLALTCWALPHAWRDRPIGTPPRSWRQRWKDQRRPSASMDGTGRTAFLEINPIYWLANRSLPARSHPWIFLGSVAAVLVFGAVRWQWPLLNAALAFGISYAVNLVFKFWISAQASQAFSADRDHGALELLLSTPLTEQEAVRGQWLALGRLFGPPLAVLWVVQSIWVLGTFLTDASIKGNSFWIGAALAVWWFLFPADVVALGWLGLWKGVTESNAKRAASSAQVCILVLPWLVAIVPPVVLGWFIGWFIQSRPPVAAGLHIILLLIASIAADLYYGRAARRLLLTELRAGAAHRSAGEPQIAHGWVRLGRWVGQRVVRLRSSGRTMNTP